MRLGFILVACVIGCSSSESSTGTDAGAAETSVDTGVLDTGATDTGAPEVASDKCVIKRAAKTADCAENCDARLFLPAGDAYCTVTCSSTAECTALGTGLICSTETGTCMPTCTTNDSCTAAGFKRCDTTVGACDTI